MKPFKITHHKQKNRLKWLNWIAIGLGLIYLYLAAIGYFGTGDSSEAAVNLVLGLFWIAFGYINLFWVDPTVPDIMLNDEGITVEKEKNTRLLRWDTIRDVHVDNNSISIHLETGQEEQPNIWPLDYKELQTLKQRLQEFTSGNEIAYSSKY